MIAGLETETDVAHTEAADLHKNIWALSDVSQCGRPFVKCATAMSFIATNANGAAQMIQYDCCIWKCSRQRGQFAELRIKKKCVERQASLREGCKASLEITIDQEVPGSI